MKKTCKKCGKDTNILYANKGIWTCENCNARYI